MRKIFVLGGLCICSVLSMADEVKSLPISPEITTEMVQPFSKAEIQQGMQEMQQRLNIRIEKRGHQLKREDFEWTWKGRQLKQNKRKEVCAIFQGVVNETFNMAQKNKARMRVGEQNLLNSRQQFIEALGFKENRVDTKMGFDCILR